MRPDIAVGTAVKLVVRPEALALVADGEAPLRATVESRTFLGEKLEYRLRCADVSLQAVTYNAGVGESFGEGTTVALRVTEDAVTILPEQTA